MTSGTTPGGEMFTGNLLRGERTIRVSPIERDWLYDERIRAMRECPNLEWQRARRSAKCLQTWHSGLRVHRRSKDGCLEASVVIKHKLSGEVYRRKLRCPSSYASSQGLGLLLRRAPTRG